MSKVTIAILGATSHIAKGLIAHFEHSDPFQLLLYARNPDKVFDFVKSEGLEKERFVIQNFDYFSVENYDAVINCIGFGNPLSILKSGYEVFSVTEYFDNLVLSYLDKNPETQYINFSSGAVYGKDFAHPAEENSNYKLSVNLLNEKDFYAITKLNSEAKHRALNFNIVDLRLFAYFSRYINLDAGFLMTEIVNCLLHDKEFITGPNNILRDYVHPSDLYSLILKCIEKKKLNCALDVYSLKPVSKFEILEEFKKKFGLKYIVESDMKGLNATGSKDNYYSIYKKAEKVGYSPIYTSLQSLIEETTFILNKSKL